jgi:hypothetical protein
LRKSKKKFVEESVSLGIVRMDERKKDNPGNCK